MNPQAIREAATLFVEARRSGILLDRLPDGLRPRDGGDAYAIQLETLALMGDEPVGWKVALPNEFDILVGALPRSRDFDDGVTIASAGMALVGVEAEIAFRFDRPLPARERPYERAEVIEAVTAFPAIEVVDTRFRDMDATPPIDRAADFMSNSAFVAGAPRHDWRSFDLSQLDVRLAVDGVEIVRTTGGHPNGDPLIPAVALVNHFRQSTGIAAGHVVTTGSCTGLRFVARDSAVRVSFSGFGDVGCRFVSGG